jgi:septum formation protein
MAKITFILASASPRRRELLHQVGLRPEIVHPDLDESAATGEGPAALATRLASAKCRQTADTLEAGNDRVVIAADTVVVLGPAILGKPNDRADARRMLELLSGRTHQVMTAVSLYRSATDRQVDGIGITDVRFRVLDEKRIEWYLATGEPMDKAGAYGIQGAGSVLVDSIRGSWTNVVGLALEMLPGWLEELGVGFEDLAAQPTRLP